MLCNDNNICCLCVSCFHFSVSLLHAWLFWKMTSLLCWKFTLVYRVQIHYAMATILVACVLQSLQNTTICTLPLQCPYVVLISKRSYLVNTPAVQRKCYWCEPYMTDASPYVSNLHRHERFILTRHFKTRYFNSLFSNETRYSWKNRVFLHAIIL